VRRAAIRIWFTLAAAIVAAAIADPCVESASNAGWFGPGNFTDHSMLDVIPALLSGALLLAIYLALRVRRELLRASNEALRTNIGRLLPAILGLQLAVLFVMETCEQLMVYGRWLGGTVWLGGPVWFSFTVHALVGTAVAFILAYLVCNCARTTVRMLRRIRALATRALHDPAPLALRRLERTCLAHEAPVRCRIGNRAPPLAFV
jgi:hypothetical protein